MKYEIKVKAEGAASEADIYINDFIGDWIDGYWGFGVTSKSFLDELQALPEAVRTVRLHINSPGGDVSSANHIANIIRDQQQHKNRTFEGLIEGAAWSAATIITSACQPTLIADNGLMMIHNPWTIILGDAGELRKQADVMDKFRNSIVAAYQWKSPLEEVELIALMDAETWMDADEAVANGFADGKIEGFRAAAALDAGELSKKGKAPVVPEKYSALFQGLLKPPAQIDGGPETASLDGGPGTEDGKPSPVPSPPSPSDFQAAAAAITELCKKNGVPELAGDFLAAGLSPDQVGERMKDAGGIRSACVAAKLPERANRYIKAGLSLDEVRSDLFEVLQARDVEIDNRLPINERRVSQVVIDTDAIYEARRKRAAH